jgi:hypothetical protein
VKERVLTERELNRALLARQLLLERVRLPIPRLLERIAGIQNQWATNGYLRLWASLDGFRRADLTRALERRTVIQGTLMRGTIHLVSARDYWLLAAGTRRALCEWALRIDKTDERDLQRRARELRKALADGPRQAKELGDAWRGHVGFWLDLVRVPPSGTWDRRRADLYGLAEAWLPRPEVSERDGLEHLVRRYLGGFGPAPPEDIASWGYVPASRLGPVLETMKLRRFRDSEGGVLLDLPHAPLPPPETPAPVRFVPTWDATLLVHARRTGILAEEYRPLVFHTKNPRSVHTFLVDGRVAGAWRHENGRIVLEPFGTLSRATKQELAEEGKRLAAFHSEEGEQ